MFVATQFTAQDLEAFKAQLWEDFKYHLQQSRLFNDHAAQARSCWESLQAIYRELAALEGRAY